MIIWIFKNSGEKMHFWLCFLKTNPDYRLLMKKRKSYYNLQLSESFAQPFKIYYEIQYLHCSAILPRPNAPRSNKETPGICSRGLFIDLFEWFSTRLGGFFKWRWASRVSIYYLCHSIPSHPKIKTNKKTTLFTGFLSILLSTGLIYNLSCSLDTNPTNTVTVILPSDSGNAT